MELTIDSTLPATKELFKKLMIKPELMFEMINIDMKSIAENTIKELLKTELTLHLGRDRYARPQQGKSNNYRNGSYVRKYTARNIGEIKIEVPRDRNCTYRSKLLRKYDRYDKVLEKDLCLMFLSGLSTRGIELISKSLIGRKISHGEISNINKELLSGIDKWRNRDLTGLDIKYIYVDGVNFKIRNSNKIENLPMLVVIGVTRANRKVFLAIQQGDKESASTWREVFKDLKARGLNSQNIELGIMDGLSGLMMVFKEEFINSKIQRCQVHVSRNVLSKVTKAKKQEVADRLRDIFYAGSVQKSRENYNSFINKYQDEFPSATKCLSNVIDECLTFYNFPEEQWRSIRTTNAIERVNKEFKRRTKSMEILAGETSSYRLLCFIALKLELSWKGNPINKSLDNLQLQKFTQ